MAAGSGYSWLWACSCRIFMDMWGRLSVFATWYEALSLAVESKSESPVLVSNRNFAEWRGHTSDKNDWTLLILCFSHNVDLGNLVWECDFQLGIYLSYPQMTIASTSTVLGYIITVFSRLYSVYVVFTVVSSHWTCLRNEFLRLLILVM